MNTIISVIFAITMLAGLIELSPVGSRSMDCIRREQVQRPVFDKDTGSGLTFEEDKPRIDQFAEEIKRNRSAEAYIIAYGGLLSYKNEAGIRLRCIRNRLIRIHKISASRLKFIDGGYRVEVSVQLFLVKPGEQKPTADPSVNREAVRMTRVSKSRCG